MPPPQEIGARDVPGVPCCSVILSTRGLSPAFIPAHEPFATRLFAWMIGSLPALCRQPLWSALPPRSVNSATPPRFETAATPRTIVASIRIAGRKDASDGSFRHAAAAHARLHRPARLRAPPAGEHPPLTSRRAALPRVRRRSAAERPAVAALRARGVRSASDMRAARARVLGVRCERCRAEKLVAFSCKRRGFLPKLRRATHGRERRVVGR